MPTVHITAPGKAPLRSEGKYTQEGGGQELFEERVESLQQLYKVLDYSFEQNEKISL
jgi:hypothetical protein